jgi:hypothetical protein
MKTRHAFLRTLGAISIAGVMLTAGCESLGFGGDNKQTDIDRQRASEPRRERERAAERRADHDADGAARRAAPDGISSLPPDARKVSESRVGDLVRYRAEEHGRVFVQDMRSERIVYAARVRPNDLLVLEPSTGRASVNDRAVTVTSPLSDAHAHAVYFQND